MTSNAISTFRGGASALYGVAVSTFVSLLDTSAHFSSIAGVNTCGVPVRSANHCYDFTNFKGVAAATPKLSSVLHSEMTLAVIGTTADYCALI